MIELYYFPSPNGLKVGIMLEECELPYRLRPVNILRGEQFAPDYLAINPNNKIPAIVDTEARGGPLPVFESGAVLLYLGERTGRFLPRDTRGRYEAVQWVFWQAGGLGPMAGQAHHFRAFAPEVVPYAIRRYTDECNRLYGVLERRLAGREWLAGDYSIADMACWPWIVHHARQGQDLGEFPEVRRWFEAMRGRPSVTRALAIGEERAADTEAHRYLYGQTAATVAVLEREQADSGGAKA